VGEVDDLLPLGSELFNLVQAGFDCDAWKAASNRTVRVSRCVNINDIIRPDLRMLGKVAGGTLPGRPLRANREPLTSSILVQLKVKGLQPRKRLRASREPHRPWSEMGM
jgi:hypothetical protein